MSAVSTDDAGQLNDEIGCSTLTFQEFCVQSLESVLVCVFVNLMYRLVYKRKAEEENEDDHQCEGPDLSELPDCYALPDHQKTARIQDLEQEVEILNRQLVDTRNQLNTVLTEMDRYKRVHGQVSWLLEQFRNTLSGVYDRPKLEAILPPPPPPLLPPPLLPQSLELLPLPPPHLRPQLLEIPLPPPPLLPQALELPPQLPSSIDSTGDNLKEILTIDLTTSETSHTISVSGGESEDDDYSDDWETTEEVTASDSTPSIGEQNPSGSDSPLPDLATLLANVDIKTHISEIFRRLTSQYHS